MTQGTNEPRHWSVLQSLPAPILVAMAQAAEASGVHGCFAAQVYGPPFVPLAAAAAVTQRIQLASGIAIASTRSPFETAMAAIDLDRISGGRFTLGLGASVLAWSQGIYGAPDHKPLAHLRETVAAVRHIVAGAHKGLEPFEGEYYSADYKDFTLTEPPVREKIPIWVAALRAPMVRLGAEIADGVMGHPMWSIEWALEKMAPALSEALEKAGRKRSEVDLNLWCWAAPGEDEAQAIEDARPSIAFYARVAQYEPFFEAHGFGDVSRKLQQTIQGGDYLSAAHLVPDDMVRAFVSVGEPEKVRERIGRLNSIADSLCVVAPVYSLEPEKVLRYSMAISEIFHGGGQ